MSNHPAKFVKTVYISESRCLIRNLVGNWELHAGPKRTLLNEAQQQMVDSAVVAGIVYEKGRVK